MWHNGLFCFQRFETVLLMACTCFTRLKLNPKVFQVVRLNLHIPKVLQAGEAKPSNPKDAAAYQYVALQYREVLLRCMYKWCKKLILRRQGFKIWLQRIAWVAHHHKHICRSKLQQQGTASNTACKSMSAAFRSSGYLVIVTTMFHAASCNSRAQQATQHTRQLLQASMLVVHIAKEGDAISCRMKAQHSAA